jgi:hypothetical protein
MTMWPMSSTAGGGGGGAAAAGLDAGLAAGFCAGAFFRVAGFWVAAGACCAVAIDGTAQARKHAATQLAPIIGREGEASMARLYSRHRAASKFVNMFYGMTWKPSSCTSLQQ